MSDEPYRITESGDPRDRITNQLPLPPKRVTTPAEHAATVLDAAKSHLASNGDWNINDWRDIASALVALAERANELERRVWDSEAMVRHQAIEIDAAEARVSELERRLAKGWDEVVAADKARAIKAEIAKEAAEARAEQELALRNAAQTALREAQAVVKAARAYIRAKDDTSWGQTKDWHKRHDKSKAEHALRAALDGGHAGRCEACSKERVLTYAQDADGEVAEVCAECRAALDGGTAT